MATGLFTLKQVNQAISQGAWSGYIAPKWVEYLVVAGGGGCGVVGGGGAGGLLTGIVTVAAGTSYTVTVGGGGGPITVGTNTSFGSITATGGGTAGASNGFGGSGGGAGHSGTIVAGQAVAGQGNRGGNNLTGGVTGTGGGGGAGTVGLDGTSSGGGNGGAGIGSSITGTLIVYAGGGGGFGTAGAGIGGVGGGGNAVSNATGGENSGSANTGGGAGGTYAVSGGAGGSGIVVVRYPGNVQFYTGGTVTYSNGYIVHNFTSSGTLAPTTPTIVSEYQISRSLRFNSADSAYLNRTPASASNRKTWTWSAWVKRGSISNSQFLFGARVANSTPYGLLGFGADSVLQYLEYVSGAFVSRTTVPVFRDVSAWYHIVFVYDTTQADSLNRIQLYVNGVQQTFNAWSGGSLAQNYDGFVNSANLHVVGYNPNYGESFDGYMTEVNFIDGQALRPTSFGYVNPSTGVWSPAKFVGGYGTNGFYLNFSDNSNTTAATLGKDYSGNGNNWTPNNFSVTAGAGNDSLVDSPTSYGTDTGVGGTVRGNYCTWNPLDKNASISTLNGNLDAFVSSGSWFSIRATFGISSGKWYWECTPDSSSALLIGIGTSQATLANYVGADAFGWSYFGSNGNKFNNNTSTAYGSAYTTNDVIGIAFDADAGTLTFYKNGTSQGTAYTGLTSGPYFPMVGIGGAITVVANFGQRPFAYTAPSGFKALCTQNLPTPTIGATTATTADKYFGINLWTGNGTSQTFTNSGGFQPDWVWLKSRSSGTNFHNLYDVLRGATKYLFSNSTAAEGTNAQALTAFTSTGFSVGNDNDVNQSSGTYVAWQWKANGAGSTNTAGSITSTVSANTTSGFSVVTYTGNATSNQTFGHGLGAKVDFAIIKSRSAVSSPAWMVWHRSVCSGNGKALALEETNAIQGPFGTPIWDSSNTSAQSSTTTFTIGANTTINASGATYVAYCFAPIAGYSAFGSYTGNGSTDGPFVFTGMRPAYVMIKQTNAASNWIVEDATRDTYNVASKVLYPNSSAAEDATFGFIDILSNGFKIRNADAWLNGTSSTYIYMAFAQNPFKYSLAR